MSNKSSTDGPHTFWIVCDNCGVDQEMPYGEAINGEVPPGWTRAPDDKTHWCPDCDTNDKRQYKKQLMEFDGNRHEGNPIYQESWFKEDPTLQPNEIRAGEAVITLWREGADLDGPPTEQIDVNAQGGKQSHLDTAAHRLDPLAMLELVEILGYGDQKYNEEMCDIGDENWRKLHHFDHLNHALVHQFKYLKELQFGPDPNDPEATQHLGHALARLMFAVGSKPRD